MADWGIKISKPGFDIGTASDSDLVFSTKFDYLKVQTSGSTNITTAGTTIINHNLGYYPSFVGFAKFNGGQYNGQTFSLPSQFPNSFVKFIHCGTDSLKIVVDSLPGTATSVDLKYVIFINQIE